MKIKKISFESFKKIMSYNISENFMIGKNSCIEIEFDIDNSDIYQISWMGKMIDIDTEKEVYWFGLSEDGSQAYSYSTFEEFIDEKIFYGEKSLKEIWLLVSIFSIDACDLEERLPYYL